MPCVTFLCGLLISTTLASEVQLRVATRDDVDDSEYLSLGAPYGAVGFVRAGNRSCTGTVVRTTDGSTKVITAAHCFDWFRENQSAVKPSSVTFQTGIALEGPSVVAVDIQVQTWDGVGGMDIAVITLAGFEPGEGPIPMTVSAAKPVGEEVTMVGYGTHGTGLPDFENLSDNQRRAATNTADEFFDEGENAGQIRLDFDHPGDPAFSTMGEAFPTELEGTSGSGDSGGPLLHNNLVVGIQHGGINPTRFEFSEYGDVSIFAGIFHEPNAAFLRANNVLVLTSVEGSVLDYETWSSTAFPGQTPMEQRARAANPDDDAFNNEMEWVLGTSPGIPDHFSPLRIDGGAETVTIRHNRQRFLPADSHHFESSPDLIHWEPAAALATTIEGGNQNTEAVALRFAQTPATRYWRLTVAK